MQEVLDEIVQILTEDKFKNKLAVIFAGYEEDMGELFEINPGLKSRISTKIKFEDFSVEDSSALLQMRLQQKSLHLSDEAKSLLNPLLYKYQAAPHWSNGRDVETLGKCIYQEQATRLAALNNEHDFNNEISLDVLSKAISTCIRQKGNKVHLSHIKVGNFYHGIFSSSKFKFKNLTINEFFIFRLTRRAQLRFLLMT